MKNRVPNSWELRESRRKGHREGFLQRVSKSRTQNGLSVLLLVLAFLPLTKEALSGTIPPVKYDEQAQELLMEKIKKQEPLSHDDTLAVGRLRALLRGRESGVVYSPPKNEFAVDYTKMQGRRDAIQVEIRDPDLGTTKEEALKWLDAAGFSKQAICNYPIQFYINYETAQSLRGKKDIVFSPLAEGCKPVPRNLIVLVHGCCTDNLSEWNAVADEIKKRIDPREWQVVVWDWTKCTPDLNVECTPNHDYIKELWRLKPDADTAYTYAFSEGKKLADAVRKYPTKHKYIHLIAHSAGSNLIDVTAKELKLDFVKIQNEEEKPFIHLTFLDAYTPSDEDKYAYGFLSGYPKHYAEHYVDKTLGGLNPTNADLMYAFSFDITNWTPDKDDRLGEFGHQWPIRWYTRSIESPDRTGVLGFKLSLEGGDEAYSTLSERFSPGGLCQLTDVLTTAICGIKLPAPLQ